MSRYSGHWISAKRRLACYERDRFRCVYCDLFDRLTLDHIDPDGPHASSNVATACLSCNSSKKRAPLRAWLAILRLRGIDTTHVIRRLRRIRRCA